MRIAKAAQSGQLASKLLTEVLNQIGVVRVFSTAFTIDGATQKSFVEGM
jgi:hypothetical protein